MTLKEEGSGSTLPGVAPLQPYLCSVPDDLQREREYLRTEVFPHLDSQCKTRGTRFSPTDFRWSRERETTKEELERDGNGERDGRRRPLSSQRLKISLDLVGRAPFFLCVLGQRYGQCRPEGSPPLPAAPEGRLDGLSPLERNLYAAGRNGHPWVLQGRNQDCGFVELEVTQALLTHGPGTAYFYFRDYSFEEGEDAEGERRELLLSAWGGQSEYERRRMRELKGRIVDTCLPVRFFKSLPELGHLVQTDWVGIMDRLYPLDLHLTGLGQPGLIEHRCHESRIEDLCSWFVPWAEAEQVFESLDSFALSTSSDLPNKPEIRSSGEQGSTEEQKSILVLCGARGCGKSTLAACWLQKFRKKNPGIPVIPQFPGLCSSSADVRSLLRRITFLLRQAHYGSQAQWSERVEERVELGPLSLAVQAFCAAAALGPCVLVLDGLDQLTETLGLTAQQVKELRWLPNVLPSECRLIVTTSSTDLSYRSLTRRTDVRVLRCPGQWDPAVRRGVLLRHLALPRATVEEATLRSIVGKKPVLPPALLALLGCELRTCGVGREEEEGEEEEEEEEELVERYLEAESLLELWALVIRRWIKDYSWAAAMRTGKRTKKRPQPPATHQTGGWVWDVLCLLHLSRSGLSEKEVRHILARLGYRRSWRVRPQHWALFRSAAGPWIRERPDGQLTLAHQSLGQAVEQLLLKAGGTSTRTAYRRTLVEVFRSGDCPVESRSRALEEVAWSLEQDQAWGELHALLTDPDTVEFLSGSPHQFQLKSDVVRCWTRLAQVGYFPPASLVPGQPCHTQDPIVTESGVLQEPEVKGRLVAFSAEVLFCLGKVVQAEQMLLQMEALLKQAEGPEGGAVAMLLRIQHSLADLSQHMQQPKRAAASCRRALDSAHLLIRACPALTEDARHTRGLLLCKLCQLLFVIGCTDEVPEILKEIEAVNHARTHPCAEATVTLLQGLNELARENVTAAESRFRGALATRRRWYGPEHPLVVEVEEHLADILAENCWESEVCWAEAAELYRHVLRFKGQEAGLHPPTSLLARPMGCSHAVTLVKLGMLLLGDGGPAERREAVALLERAFDLRVRLLTPDHPLTKEIAEVLRLEVAGLGHPPGVERPLGSASGPETSRLAGKGSGSRSLGDRKEMARSWPLTDTPPPIQNRNRNRDRPSQRPWTTCLASVFGPGTSVGDLDPAPRVGVPDRVLHKSAWYHLPGRYPVSHLERQKRPPNAVTRPDGQIHSNTSTHPKRQIRPKNISRPERQTHPPNTDKELHKSTGKQTIHIDITALHRT